MTNRQRQTPPPPYTPASADHIAPAAASRLRRRQPSSGSDSLCGRCSQQPERPWARGSGPSIQHPPTSSTMRTRRGSTRQTGDTDWVEPAVVWVWASGRQPPGSPHPCCIRHESRPMLHVAARVLAGACRRFLLRGRDRVCREHIILQHDPSSVSHGHETPVGVACVAARLGWRTSSGFPLRPATATLLCTSALTAAA